jgi:hypothetical protein
MSAKDVRRALALSGIITVAAAGIASAAHPKRGATYRGVITYTTVVGTGRTFPISFRVSGNGKRVSDFKVLVLAAAGSCQFATYGTPRPGSAAVSKKGTFKASMPLASMGTPTRGKIVVTGKFLNGGKESGKISLVGVPDSSAGTKCGATEPYSTRG